MKKLWGSRFQEELAQDAREFSFSLDVDQELLGPEIKVSMAHALMLAKVGLLTKKESDRLVKGLWAVLAELRKADLGKLRSSYEDIHTLIQATLEKKVGAVAKKLHTGRSRNDLVPTSTRIYLREKLDELREATVGLQKALIDFAEKSGGIPIPGYTHLQRAQVVLLGHHLLAYVSMLDRDHARLDGALERVNQCPLGAGALAGSSLPIDRTFVAKLLQFDGVVENSMDAVSDRDFIVESHSALAILFMHLSRLAEDLILWNSKEFGFIRISDAYATGSSLMPQKKNPDILELVRGRSGSIFGNLISILTTLKGLPLAYNRDMQEDKRALFESVRITRESLKILANVLRAIEVDRSACERAVSDSLLYATDLLEYLVAKGTAFQDAHELVGKMVRHSLSIDRELRTLSFKELKRFSPLIERDVYDLFDPKKSLNRKKSLGSTHPDSVRRQIAKWKKNLSRFRRKFSH